MRERADRRLLQQIVGIRVAMHEGPREGAQSFELAEHGIRTHTRSMPRPFEVLAGPAKNFTGATCDSD